MIIKSSGILCYSKTFYGEDKIDDDFISGFLTAILDISQKIGGGEIKSLNFRNFNINYSYDDDKLCIFILVSDINDPEEELRDKIGLLKTEFIKQYRENIVNWDDDVSKFEKFNEFTDKNIYLPPKVLLIGEDGVGKTTILNLFPGDLLIELDDDMNEVIQKSIKLPNFKRIKKCLLRELNIEDLINNPMGYNHLLYSANIICFVTNSGASNLSRTRNYFSSLETKSIKADFYVIANFQDLKKISFEPEKIEELFGLKTYGFSAIADNAKEWIFSILLEILSKIILE
ncbi:MAG: hypothetical protein ACFE8B_15990 [Candidatus Hermodarchaeota archaeon]